MRKTQLATLLVLCFLLSGNLYGLSEPINGLAMTAQSLGVETAGVTLTEATPILEASEEEQAALPLFTTPSFAPTPTSICPIHPSCVLACEELCGQNDFACNQACIFAYCC